jgi:membrane-bound metal-dependent hydrolase YbcI (DUF457 family)
MDSLSQIVLGAAVGEAVLGRRIGNRAMIWGAVAGTIPDMDVLGKYFLSELDNLAFHRGISHSLLFCVLGALAIGWVADRLYRSRYHAWLAMCTKAAAAVIVCFVVNFLTEIFAPGAWWPCCRVHSAGCFLALESWPTALFCWELEGSRSGFERLDFVVFLGILDPRFVGLFYHVRNSGFRSVFQPACRLGNRFCG